MLHWELRLLVQLSVSESALFYPLISNLQSESDPNSKAIEELFKNDMRRAIVHAFVLLGGRADFK